MSETDIATDIERDLDIDIELVDLSARYAHGFLRWLDAGKGGFSYPRLRVLEALHCEGPKTMRTLADRLGLSARNMTAVADSLEDEGLVRRVGHPTDRRVTILELTPSGLAVANEALAPRFAEISRLFDELSPSARAKFRQSLQVLVTAMEQGCPKECP